MLYIIVEIDEQGKYICHICKANSIAEAKIIADVKRNASYDVAVSKDEIFALLSIDKGCVMKLM